MADRYLLESGAPDGYLLEDGSGVYLLDDTTLDIVNHTGTTVTYVGSGQYQLRKTGGVNGSYDADAVSSVTLPNNAEVIAQWVSGIGFVGLNPNDPTLDATFATGQTFILAPNAGNWNLYNRFGTQVAVGPQPLTTHPYGRLIYDKASDTYYAYSSADGVSWGTAFGNTTGSGSAAQYFDSSLNTTGATIIVSAKAYAAAYSLAAASGAFALTGTAMTPKAAHILATASGSYALNGSAVGLAHGYKLATASGAFTLTGSAVTLLKALRITTLSGAYVLTGKTVGLAKGYRLVTASAAFALAGSNVGLFKGFRTSALSGAFVLTGKAVGLLKGFRLPALSGTYTLTGSAVTLNKGFRMVTASASFTLNGSAVGFKAARRLVTASAAFALTGSAVGLAAARRLALASGAFTINGSAVTLIYSPILSGYSLTAAPGTFTLNGSAVLFRYSRRMPVAAGAYALTGTNLGFLLGKGMQARGGSYDFYGYPVTLHLVRTPFYPDNAPADASLVRPLVPDEVPVVAAGAPIPPPQSFTVAAEPPAVELET